MNVAETEMLRAEFVRGGFSVVGGSGVGYSVAVEGGAMDVIVINSCAVTSIAEKGALQLLRRLRERNGRAVIALAGCVGEMLIKKGKRELEGADIMVGCNKNGLYEKINNKLKAMYMPKEPTAGVQYDGTSKCSSLADDYITPARSNVLVQNGCDCFCSYCIVPRLRGKPVSVPLVDIVRELESKAAAGCKEIVLSGINLSLYKDGSNMLIDVLRATDSITGIERIRLSSLEPSAFTNELVGALPDIRKLCPHFHIPLQSGCDDTLMAMNRRYTMNDYLKMLARLRAALPDISVTTDIIVGFPGESDEHFRQSCRGIVRCLFDDIHIFKFSAREGTAAATMPDQVTEHKKAARAMHLQGIKQQALYRFLHGFIGNNADVLFLNLLSSGLWEGTTPHNAVIRARSDVQLLNEIRKIKIIDVDETGSFLEGSLL